MLSTFYIGILITLRRRDIKNLWIQKEKATTRH